MLKTYLHLHIKAYQALPNIQEKHYVGESNQY